MKKYLDLLDRLPFLFSIFSVILFFLDFGIPELKMYQRLINFFYITTLILGIYATIRRNYTLHITRSYRTLGFDIFYVVFVGFILYQHIIDFKINNILLKFAIFLPFIRELFALNFDFKRKVINPAQLFILSFFIVILLGAFLLMLPKASTQHVSFIDALFTSTSAVCVTGLAVVDTGTVYTQFGQSIILMLIQIGGLGILTFASYFSYFFRGTSSYENQIVLGDITNSKKLNDVFYILKSILIITFSIELFIAIFIFYSVDSQLFPTWQDQIFFSVFHSISAFCNAGFSTLSNGLYDIHYRFNYFFQLAIIASFVLGGLGFPIVSNLMSYIKSKIVYFFSTKKQKIKRPWVLNLDSRITLITTLSISFIAFFIYFALEYYGSLAEHSSIFGKAVTALFGITTPRTAGFNTIDMSLLPFASIFLIILLMWIGASPSSTGGGIKTNTFAIAFLNILALAQGKSKIEVFRREIADITIKRAYATIFLSMVMIGLGIFFISINDAKLGLLKIAFECVSAYSTVGLSLGITYQFSWISKLILIALMFIGRVSMLSILIAVVKKINYKKYQYPKEEILIN